MKKKSTLILIGTILLFLALFLVVTYGYYSQTVKTYNLLQKVVVPSSAPTFVVSSGGSLTLNVYENNMTMDNIGTTLTSSTTSLETTLSTYGTITSSYCCTYNIKMSYSGALSNFVGFNLTLSRNGTQLYSNNITLTSGMSAVTLASQSLCATAGTSAQTLSYTYSAVGKIVNNNTVQDQLYTTGTQTITVYVDNISCE